MPPRAEQLRRVGGSELMLPQLGLGGVGVGDDGISDADALGTIEAAWAEGIRYYDTAPFYNRGRSERRMGVGLSNHPRQDFCLNTKVGRYLVPVGEAAAGAWREPEGDSPLSKGMFAQTARGHEVGIRYDYSYDAIMRQWEDSLQRLGVSAVDSLVIHDLDRMFNSQEQCDGYLVELEGGMKALEELRASGKVKAIGAGCNDFTFGGDEFCRRMTELGRLDFILVAGNYVSVPLPHPAVL